MEKRRDRLRWPVVAVCLGLPLLVVVLVVLAAVLSVGRLLQLGPYQFSAYAAESVHPQGFSRQGREHFLKIGNLHWTVASE